ncbi:response regulator [Ramlibacter sp.]|uniref:response regulator n=1 Tax=Ramlibacter sp. TaxID=1917967 RepID=UPI002CBA35CA|nr:response regulator [Ramlibacter sp.]HWI84178.1 response regulator [Ramlibacter sp.]
MNDSQTKTAMGPAGPLGSQAPRMPPPDGLLGGTIFGPTPAPAAVPPAPRPPLPAAAGEAAPALRLAVKGLKPIERQLLDGLVKVSQRRTPRLEILDDARARQADVVVVDARDPAAMAWAQQRSWLARRAVIWIDGTQAGPGHTLLRRPVQWPILPMVLARALEGGPGTASAAARPAAVAAASPPTPLAAAQSPQVLVVDDSLAVRAHLRSLLEPRGYQVTDADSVDGALERISQRRFDCILMDVLMPGLDGYEGCHRIKERLRGADAVPVVMLTAKTSPFDRIRGKMAGCDAYLTKPVDPQHLGEVLAQQVRSGDRGALRPPVHRH